MIDVEIEDEAWTTALPEAEAVVVKTAQAVLSSPPCGERSDEGVQAPQSAHVSSTPPPPVPPRKGEESMTILLTDDATIQDLNARFRGKDAITNVLSFPAPSIARPHLGDIALAYGVCVQEAEAQGKPLAHHLMHLTAHGVLHLLGYDHESDVDAEEMEALEREILAGLGVPDPYARNADAIRD